MTGREGFGIALTGSTGLRNEWMFSKDTYAFLGTRATQVTDVPGFVPLTAGPAPKSAHRSRSRARHLDRGAWHLRPRTRGRHAPRRDRDRGANSLGGKPTLFA
jgi:hypothetical protein